MGVFVTELTLFQPNPACFPKPNQTVVFLKANKVIFLPKPNQVVSMQ